MNGIKVYTFDSQSYEVPADWSEQQVRDLIAARNPSVREANFTATTTGGSFVLGTGEKGN